MNFKPIERSKFEDFQLNQLKSRAFSGILASIGATENGLKSLKFELILCSTHVSSSKFDSDVILKSSSEASTVLVSD